MGSGWVPAADDARATPRRRVRRSPSCPASRRPRSRATPARSARYAIGGKRALVFLGRTHLYEGRGVAAVVARRPHRGRRGLPTVVLTNGCGGLRAGMRARPAGADQRPHQPDGDLADRRRELRRPHRPVLAAAARAVPARSTRPWRRASTSSSPARTTRRRPRSAWSAPSAATWSACPPTLEAIAAREAGAEVLGISLVTNLAAGMTGEPLNHEEVLAGGPRVRRPHGQPARCDRLARCERSAARHRARATAADADETRNAATGSRSPRARHADDTIDVATRPRPGWPRTRTPTTRAELAGAARPPATRRRRSADRFAGHARSSAPPGCAASSGAGPEPDEPRRRHPRRRRARRVPAARTAGRRARRHRLRRAAQVRRLRPGHRRGDGRRRPARRRCCPARCPTPVLAFASGTSAPPPASMVTASHNPPRDNGYKVYLGDGSQIVPPADAEIAARDRRGRAARRRPAAPTTAGTTLGEDVVEAYLRPGRRACSTPGAPARPVASSTRRCTASAADRAPRGLRARRLPGAARSSPSRPSPTRTSRPSPSPTRRSRARWTWPSRPRARAAADLVIANDPDADRCAVAVPDPRRRRLADAARRRGRRAARRAPGAPRRADAAGTLRRVASSRRRCSAGSPRPPGSATRRR